MASEAAGMRGELSFGECDPAALGGATDDGRDHPAPLVEEAGEVEVNLVVTRRECEGDGWTCGLATCTWLLISLTCDT